MEKYKEGARILHGAVKILTAQVKKLDGTARRAEELIKANAILTAEVTSLCETLDKSKARCCQGVQGLIAILQPTGVSVWQGLRGL